MLSTQEGSRCLFSAIASRLALGKIQPHIQGALRALSLEVMQLGHEADHSLLLAAEIKNV
jgi:hypothetical protein